MGTMLLNMLALEFLLIRQAHVVHGYTLKEITAHLGLHYSTAGKAFARAEQES
jgi:transposase